MKRIVGFGCALLAVMTAFGGGKVIRDADEPEKLHPYPPPPRRIGDETPEAKAQRLKWWRDARFGMFIHFGLYAIPARGEWVRSNEKIPIEKYEQTYFPRFNPDQFDARAWARAAKAAGMKYMVLTTKHHEGFCLWDSDQTDFKITKTPFGRDLVKEYVEACRAEGLGVGFYYSVIDWHHPDFTIDRTHPLRQEGWPNWDDAKLAEANKTRDMAKYRAYLFAQVRELLTRYGKIDIVWYDYTEPYKYGKDWRDWDAIRLVKMTRELQPGIIINDRVGLRDTEDGWDFLSPEQILVSEQPSWEGKPVPWETCQTFSGSWGYARDEHTWKEPHELIRLLIHSVSFNGNLIMNVGPTARGEFDRRARTRLEAFGAWMHANSRAIYGCGAAPADLVPPVGTRLTYNPTTKRLYLHLLEWPGKGLPVDFVDSIAFASFLHDGSEVKTHPGWLASPKGASLVPGGLVLPACKPDVEIPVVEIELKD